MDGRFSGVLYVSLPVTYFERLFARYELSEQDAVALRTETLRLVARHAPGGASGVGIGDLSISDELAAAVASNPSQGVFVSRTKFDRIERTSVYRHVEGWPFIVLAGVGNERFFGPWRSQAWQLSFFAFLAWGLIALATHAVYRLWRQADANARALANETMRAQALMRVAGDGIHVTDHRGILVDMSDSFAHMLGTKPSQLLGRHISSWDVNQDREHITAWLAQVKDGDRQLVDVQHRREDGSIIDVELHLSVTKLNGELFVFGSSRDVTERKRLLTSLEESSKEIHDLYDNAPCGYHSLNTDAVFMHANATLLEWLGCTADEVIGRARMTDFLDSAGRATFAENFALLKEMGHVDGVEIRLLPRRGRIRWIRVNVRAVFGADGRFLMTRSSTQDVTAHHEAQVEADRLLREQAAMLDSDIVGMIKLQGRKALWLNKALERLFGYEPDELNGRSTRVLYPDDEAFEALGAAAYPVLESGERYTTQIRMSHKDGHLLWIDLTGVSLQDGVSFWMMVDITERKEAQARIEHIAFHDALTGLPNRVLLIDRLQRSIASATSVGKCVAVCYLDLDGFKRVNDLHGHDAGDALLVHVARRIQAALRGSDTAARVGGDEFVVLLAMLEEGEWRRIAERLLHSINAPIKLPDGSLAEVHVSIGVAQAPRGGTDPNKLLIDADQAMLQAKRAGKGRVVEAGAAASDPAG